MAQNNGLPRPEAIWIALGIVVWALAEALEDGRGRRFLAALDRLADEHAAQGRIVAFDPPVRGGRAMSHAARVAATWVSRIAAELRAAGK